MTIPGRTHSKTPLNSKLFKTATATNSEVKCKTVTTLKGRHRGLSSFKIVPHYSPWNKKNVLKNKLIKAFTAMSYNIYLLK